MSSQSRGYYRARPASASSRLNGILIVNIFSKTVAFKLCYLILNRFQIFISWQSTGRLHVNCLGEVKNNPLTILWSRKSPSLFCEVGNPPFTKICPKTVKINVNRRKLLTFILLKETPLGSFLHPPKQLTWASLCIHNIIYIKSKSYAYVSLLMIHSWSESDLIGPGTGSN